MFKFCRRRKDEIELQHDFKIERYLGRWYEIYRTKNNPFEKGNNVTAEYSSVDDGKIQVKNQEWIGRWNKVEGIAKIIDSREPARLGVKFVLNVFISWFIPWGDYRVLSTDYDRISLVYSEWSFLGLFKRKYGWILSRRQEITKEEEERAFRIFEARTGLTKQDFTKTPQLF